MLPGEIFEWSLGSIFLFMLAVTGAVALALHLIFFLPPLQRMSIRIGDLSPILQNLAGMHHGITEKADPGNPVTGNGYEKRAKYIPGNWFDAIDAFWRASILKEYFGKDFVDTYCTLKEVEADRFYAEPTTRDFEWYLRTV